MPKDKTGSFLKSLTVLLVEDDPMALEETGIFLGHRVGRLVTARDGASGLAVFAAEHPQIVVTDIQMPILDGLGMVGQLRAQQPDLPVVVVTAFGETDYLVRSIELGIDRYVFKPIQPHALENALQACARRLMAENELRMQEQREAESRQAKEEAVRAMLLSGLAHDYNNLVQAILMSVTLAKMTTGHESEMRKYLDLAMNNAEEARLLSRRLALLCQVPKPMQKRGPLEPLIRTSVSEVLAGTAIAGQFHFRDGSRNVCYDADHLGLVFSSLAENAMEAMAGKGTFQVSTDACEVREGDGLGVPSGRYLRIRCTDTGPGIPEETLPLIFQPYYTTKDWSSKRGTGLGLAISEGIVRAHGGSITVETRPGQGATFVIHFPIQPEDT